MNNEQSKATVQSDGAEQASAHSMRAETTKTTSSNTMPVRRRMTQNFLVVWVNANFDQSNKECQNTLAQLQSVVNDVHVFLQQDEAIDFVTKIENMKAFLIIQDTIGELILPLIHDISQVNTVYIFCDNKVQQEQWTKQWVKIKGVHTEIKSLCDALRLSVKQCNQDSTPISFISMGDEGFSQNLNRLEPSYMYTQIFKEILLEMKHDDKSIKNFVTYCRNGNYGSPDNINRFEKEYEPKLAIWWYTSPTFIYSMLNYALRLMEADTIINMGFFMRDLHQQIAQLHQNQVDLYDAKSFTVYRGQGLLKTDFEKLRKSQSGLISFNNFLSTSKDPDVSQMFSMSASTTVDMVGIVFKMTIDPSVSSAPFALIKEISYFKEEEEEILFSMHTVFLVGEITNLDNNNSLYQLDLQLTADDDEQLRSLTKRIGEEVAGATGWQRLSGLLMKINQFAKAEELYNALLQQTSDDGEKAAYYNNLGYIKDDQGDYKSAIEYYERSLEILVKTLPHNHLVLATSYSNIGTMYMNMGEYQRALSFYEKALGIRQKTLPANLSDLAVSYNNIGVVYGNMGDYSKALSFHEKALEIQKKTLPENHPVLATSYNNISEAYMNTAEYSKALSFYEKALEIRQKTLPHNHPALATSYSNTGTMYMNMGEYPKALSFYEKALEIQQKNLPENQPLIATYYNNIGMVYKNMGEYSKSLSFYDKSLEIQQKTLPHNHPEMAISYNNIGGVHMRMAEYSKALLFFEKALEIQQKTLPDNHPDLTTSYSNIGMAYHKTGDYSKALSLYEKSLEIRQKTPPANHPDLASSYNNIGTVYDDRGEYSKALFFYEKALEIQQKILPDIHPDVAGTYSNIAYLYYKMDEYSKALSFFQRAQKIWQSSLPANHPNIKTVQKRIELVRTKM